MRVAVTLAIGPHLNASPLTWPLVTLVLFVMAIGTALTLTLLDPSSRALGFGAVIALEFVLIIAIGLNLRPANRRSQ